MSTRIFCAALIIVLAAALFSGCTSYSPERVKSESDLDLDTVNELFHVKFGDDATVAESSVSTVDIDEETSETIINVVVEFPAEKNEKYRDMLSNSYQQLTAGEADELETYSSALKRHFSPAPDGFDSVLQRFDILKKETNYLFYGSEERWPTEALAGIVYGETTTTVYLHTTGY